MNRAGKGGDNARIVGNTSTIHTNILANTLLLFVSSHEMSLLVTQ